MSIHDANQAELPSEPPEWLDDICNLDGVDPPWPPEFGVYFERDFVCPCGETWTDIHDCDCNDHCPACDWEIEPSNTRARDAKTGEYLEPIGSGLDADQH